MFHFRIRLPLNDFLDLESRSDEATGHLGRLEQIKIHADRLAPPLVQMDDPFPDVKGQQEEAARPQHAPQPDQHRRQVTGRDVDEGVKGDDASPSSLGCGERLHVPLPELYAGSQTARHLDHDRRQVHTEDRDALLVQVAGDVARSTAQVAHRTGRLHAGGEPVEQLSVERFVRQFIEDASHVFSGHAVVAGLAIVRWVRDNSQYGIMLAEQVDPTSGEAIAPAPLTWSHAEYVSTLLDTIAGVDTHA